jgi:hypothetical protein
VRVGSVVVVSAVIWVVWVVSVARCRFRGPCVRDRVRVGASASAPATVDDINLMIVNDVSSASSAAGATRVVAGGDPAGLHY